MGVGRGVGGDGGEDVERGSKPAGKVGKLTTQNKEVNWGNIFRIMEAKFISTCKSFTYMEKKTHQNLHP